MSKIATDDLLRTLILIRDIFPEAPLPLAIVLLAVLENEGASQKEIGKRIGGPRRFYRHLQRIGGGDFEASGLNLIAALPHEDGRAASLYLTKAGHRLVDRLRAEGLWRADEVGPAFPSVL